MQRSYISKTRILSTFSIRKAEQCCRTQIISRASDMLRQNFTKCLVDLGSVIQSSYEKKHVNMERHAKKGIRSGEDRHKDAKISYSLWSNNTNVSGVWCINQMHRGRIVSPYSRKEPTVRFRSRNAVTLNWARGFGLGAVKFQEYFLRHTFYVVTDHKPLVGLFKPDKPCWQWRLHESNDELCYEVHTLIGNSTRQAIQMPLKTPLAHLQFQECWMTNWTKKARKVHGDCMLPMKH